MDTMEGLWFSILWFVLRFGIPILITITLVWIFSKLDARWRKQAEEVRAQAIADGMVPVVKCWLLNDCPEDAKVNCIAYQDQGKPCWQHFRTKDGCLKDGCIDCEVFRRAPVPVIGD
jgi:hypothetical protein